MPRKKKIEGQGEKPADAQQPQQPAPQAPNRFPFLTTPAETGGVIIGKEERESERKLTDEDLAAAREEQYASSQQLREVQREQKELAKKEFELEQQLKSTRTQMREKEAQALDIGDHLATFAEEVHSGFRKITIECAMTLTRGNEVVITDGRDGKELERRTASKEELEKGLFKDGQLFGTSDSPTPKEKPDERPVTVSVLKDGVKNAARTVRKSLEAPLLPEGAEDEAEGYAVNWVPAVRDPARLIAIVPFWVAQKAKAIAERAPQIGFRIEPEDGQQTIEVGPAK